MPDFHRFATCESEEEFCEAVGHALRRCLGLMEDRRKVLAKAGEVELSTDLTDKLMCLGLHAHAEMNVNGHVDVVVEHFEVGTYRMLGECKLHRSPKYHCDGTNQVLGYCGGTEKRAFCLTFFKKSPVATGMQAIREHFDAHRDCHRVVETNDHPLPWTFLGCHQHRSSGGTVEVLHLGCNLHVPS